jgi:hypothetical protein
MNTDLCRRSHTTVECVMSILSFCLCGLFQIEPRIDKTGSDSRESVFIREIRG